MTAEGVPLHSQDIPGRSKLRYCVAPETKRDMRCFYGGGGNFPVDGKSYSYPLVNHDFPYESGKFGDIPSIFRHICFGAFWRWWAASVLALQCDPFWARDPLDIVDWVYVLVFMAGWNHPMSCRSCRRCTPEICGRCSANGGWKTYPTYPPSMVTAAGFFLNAYPQSQRFCFPCPECKMMCDLEGTPIFWSLRDQPPFFWHMLGGRWFFLFHQFGTANSDPRVKPVSR